MVTNMIDLRVTDVDSEELGPSDSACGMSRLDTARKSDASLDTSTEDLSQPVYRKHSSGDLHSRLKTRKLLGVGETDDGDVHRSKLSQILGHSEQLYVRLPRGIRIWQFLTALMFTVMGIWAVAFPTHLFRFAVAADADASALLPIRLYGGALLSLAVIFWCTLQSIDKDIIRWSLLGSAVYFIIQIIVSCVWMYERGEFSKHSASLLAHRAFGSAGSLAYYCMIGDKKYKMRKANSTSDLTKTQ